MGLDILKKFYFICFQHAAVQRPVSNASAIKDKLAEKKSSGKIVVNQQMPGSKDQIE